MGRERFYSSNSHEVAPNDKFGSDARSLASATLLGSDIIDEEGADPKENPLAAVAAPAEAITAGVISDDASKEKVSAGADKASSFSFFKPLSPETDPVPLSMEDEEDEPKENPPTPLDLGGANNAAPK